MSRIRLVVGLGNPGVPYQRTRHNAGFWFVDELASRYGGQFRSEYRGQCETAAIEVGGAVLWLLKPQLYMNRSGTPVLTYSRYRNIRPEEMLVAHDELDFAPGVARLKVGGGHGGHNGLRDLIAGFGGGGFARVRLGIGRAPSGDRGADYVLSKPTAEEDRAIRGAIGRVAELFPVIAAGDFSVAMNALNAREHRS